MPTWTTIAAFASASFILLIIPGPAVLYIVNRSVSDGRSAGLAAVSGLTLGNLTPQMSRRLQMPSGQAGAVVTDVDDSGPSAGILRPGDVILSVNGQAVSSAVDAGRELQKIPAGRIARILVWRGDGEVFVTVRKE